jgi:hypothetical protein
LELVVDKESSMSAQKVRLADMGHTGNEWRTIFPTQQEKSKTGMALKEDFVYDWKFKGQTKIGPEYARTYEAKQPNTSNTWWPCTLSEETADGKFTVTLTMPEKLEQQQTMSLEQFYTEMEYLKTITQVWPGFGKLLLNGEYEDIRMMDGHTPLKVLRKNLVVFIPRNDPLHQTKLELFDGFEKEGQGVAVTNYFARPSPAPVVEGGKLKGPGPIRVCKIDIDKDRKKAAIVGEEWSTQYFQTWVENKVSMETAKHENKTKAEWTFRIGLDQHTITIQQKKAGGVLSSTKLMSVTVDGQLFMETTPENLALMQEVPPEEAKKINNMELEFKFKKTQYFNFNCWAVNRDGISCGDAPVEKKKQFNADTKCIIHVRDVNDYVSTELSFAQGDFSNEIVWGELPLWTEPTSSEPFSCVPNMLETYYCKDLKGFALPWIVDERAVAGVMHSAQAFLQAAKNTKDGLGGKDTGGCGFLFGMCSSPTTDTQEQVVQ